jgi:tetratricopeptide (TPR) repeat protein
MPLFLANLAAAEKEVCSQHGEDGVIEAIFAAIGVTNRRFVEFGVEDATECDTAHLLQQGWTSLMMDMEGISGNPLASIQRESVTAENVNQLFAKYHVPREFDLLSIDIDGNDYWVGKALAYRPRAVVIEYNASVPPELRRVIPYDPHFRWNGSDYFGASLRQQGDLKQAEQIYRQILQVDPDNPDAHHLLGMVAQGTGTREAGIALIRKAIALNPVQAAYHSNLGIALHKQGQLVEAIASYREALSLRPDNALAQANLANALRGQEQR